MKQLSIIILSIVLNIGIHAQDAVHWGEFHSTFSLVHPVEVIHRA